MCVDFVYYDSFFALIEVAFVNAGSGEEGAVVDFCLLARLLAAGL